MSEFSESYHLRAESQEAARQLLLKAGTAGYVMPPGNGWVTFVAADGTFEPDSRIIEHNAGTLVHYVYAEDHGWSFAIFKGPDQALAYKAQWDEELVVTDQAFDIEKFRGFVKEVGGDDPTEFLKLLQLDDIEEVLEAEPAKIMAGILGLEHFDWLNYDYVSDDDEDGESGGEEGVLEVRPGS